MSEIKTEVVRLRITKALKEQLTAAAKAENRTMSNYIESLIIKSFDDEKKEENFSKPIDFVATK